MKANRNKQYQRGIYTNTRTTRTYQIRGQQPHFSPLIQINYTILNPLSCPGNLNNYIPKDFCDRALGDY